MLFTVNAYTVLIFMRVWDFNDDGKRNRDSPNLFFNKQVYPYLSDQSYTYHYPECISTEALKKANTLMWQQLLLTSVAVDFSLSIMLKNI